MMALLFIMESQSINLRSLFIRLNSHQPSNLNNSKITSAFAELKILISATSHKKDSYIFEGQIKSWLCQIHLNSHLSWTIHLILQANNVASFSLWFCTLFRKWRLPSMSSNRKDNRQKGQNVTHLYLTVLSYSTCL